MFQVRARCQHLVVSAHNVPVSPDVLQFQNSAQHHGSHSSLDIPQFLAQVSLSLVHIHSSRSNSSVQRRAGSVPWRSPVDGVGGGEGDTEEHSPGGSGLSPGLDTSHCDH